MYCSNCGAVLENEVSTCAGCGKTSSTTQSRAEASKAIKEAGGDALTAIRQIVLDPIAGLSRAFSALDERRARAAGVTFGIAFALLVAVAALVATRGFGWRGAPARLLGSFVLALVPFGAFALSSAGARRVLRGTGTIGADLFVAGVALQPIGLLTVVAALLGIANYQFILILSVFAWTYMLCILFVGCTRLIVIPERFAPPTVAVMLLLAIWLTKIASTALLTSSSPFRAFLPD